MDLNRLTRGDQLILASGVVLVFVSSFNWLGAKITRIGIPGTARSLPASHLDLTFAHNAWGYTVTRSAVLLGIAMLAYVTLKFVGLEVPHRLGPWSAGQVMLGLGSMALVLVLTKVAAGSRVELASFGLPNLPTGIGSALRISIHKTRSPGSFAGVGAAAGLFIGGLLKFREKGTPTEHG